MEAVAKQVALQRNKSEQDWDHHGETLLISFSIRSYTILGFTHVIKYIILH